jgi:prepilin-type N-terminal cleavage/methylation domain-containing protein
MTALRGQAGFTFIELVVVMAITGLMITGVLMGQTGSRTKTAFTAAVDAVKNQVTGLQNEATQSVIDPVGAANRPRGYGNSGYEVYGKLAVFDGDAPGQISVYTLVWDESHPSYGLATCDPTTIPLRSGLQYHPVGGVAGTRQALIFTRHPEYIYTAPSNFSLTPTPEAPPTGGGNVGNSPKNILNPANYTTANGYTATITISLQDSEGQSAKLTVNPVGNGIERSFEP